MQIKLIVVERGLSVHADVSHSMLSFKTPRYCCIANTRQEKEDLNKTYRMLTILGTYLPSTIPGGVTPLYKLYRYVRRQRVWFLAVLV